GVQAVLDHIGRAPLAGDHGVAAEMPPEIVGQLLRAAILLPRALDLETGVVEQENAARPIAIRRADSVDVDRVGAAMDSMGAAIAGLGVDLLRLDRLDDSWLAGIGFGVDNVDARRA